MILHALLSVLIGFNAQNIRHHLLFLNAKGYTLITAAKVDCDLDCDIASGRGLSLMRVCKLTG